MNIIGYHISDVIANSNGEVCSEPPYLEWLLAQGSKDTIQVMYHMDYDVANLLRLLEFTEEEGQKLLKRGKFSILTTSGRYSIFYIPGKYFSVSKGVHMNRPYAVFSNMAQYMDVRFHSNPVYLTSYLIENACKAKLIGEQVYEALVSIGLLPTVLTSPISAYRKEVIDKMGKWVEVSDTEEQWVSDIPTVDDIPDEVGE